MVTAGVRGPIVAVAVVGDGEDPCTPCGACRQTIFEFGPDATVYASGDGGRPLVTHHRAAAPRVRAAAARQGQGRDAMGPR
jgi:cytidine deaminase